MRPPFKDNIAIPLPGLPLADVCPTAGVINPIAYNVIEADKSLVGVGINPGDDIYILSTADVYDGDLAAIKTPDGIFVRFTHWYATQTGFKIELRAANPEIAAMHYDYDDSTIRTRWRVAWICRHDDHGRCAAYRRTERGIC